MYDRVLQNYFDVLERHGDKPAFWYEGRYFSFVQIETLTRILEKKITNEGIKAHSVVVVQGDIEPYSIALLFACMRLSLICVPLGELTPHQLQKKVAISNAGFVLSAAPSGSDVCLDVNRTNETGHHVLFDEIGRDDAGMVVFSSGTTGEPKAALHSCNRSLSRFVKPENGSKTIAFLLFDHWGGLNTIFHTLFQGGTIICIPDRQPETICKIIQDTQAEILPVSPSFLNLLLASWAHKKFDLSSVKLITYGSEPMPQSTLEKIAELFPNSKLKQTYGLIELGVFPSRSENKESLYFQIHSEIVQWRITDGLLEIKSPFVMIGYLNSSSPFTSDGWYMTRDQVLEKDGFIRVVGRNSDIINVGGEKVFPMEVEEQLNILTEVVDSKVFGEENFLLGNIVCAKVQVKHDIALTPELKSDLETRIKAQLKRSLEPFKIPMKISFQHETMVTERMKKSRSPSERI